MLMSAELWSDGVEAVLPPYVESQTGFFPPPAAGFSSGGYSFGRASAGFPGRMSPGMLTSGAVKKV
jgi:hypothetical protein